MLIELQGREILETVIGTYETAQMKQDKQVYVIKYDYANN